jgi:hypothetical protein
VVGFLLGVGLGVAGALAFRSSREGDAVPGSRAEAGTEPAPTGAASLEGAPADVGDLRRRLAESEARVRDLEGRLARVPAAAPAAAPAPRAPPADELPAAVRIHAARLRVSDAALQATWKARNEYYGAPPAVRASLLDSLRPYGEETLRAVVALTAGGGGHIDLPDIVADLALDGGAELVIRAVEDEPSAASLVKGLRGYDSPRVRDWLLDRVARADGVAAVWHTAEALGDLHEPRGADRLRVAQFLAPEYAGVRGHVLGAVGQMGGTSAVRLLEEYLRIPAADSLGTALAALARLDARAARAHAQRLRDGERWAFLDVPTRSQVLELLKDR